MMDTKKRPFNHRAFVAIMTGLTGLSLPISGWVLHAYSDHRIVAGRHAWFTMHVFWGILFLILAVWHIVLNRRPLLNYFKSGAADSLSLSREACWSVTITAALLIIMMLHSL